MRAAVTAILIVVGLSVVLGDSVFPRTSAQSNQLAVPSGASSGELIAFSSDVGQGVQQITLIDPKTRVMSVYHVNSANGAVALRSVRNVQWDLQMDEFNGVAPSPREIRSLLQQR